MNISHSGLLNNFKSRSYLKENNLLLTNTTKHSLSLTLSYAHLTGLYKTYLIRVIPPQFAKSQARPLSLNWIFILLPNIHTLLKGLQN